jgi:hypothetical protein
MINIMSGRKRLSWARAINKLPIKKRLQIKLLVTLGRDGPTWKALAQAQESGQRYLESLLRPISLQDKFEDGFGLEILFAEDT